MSQAHVIPQCESTILSASLVRHHLKSLNSTKWNISSDSKNKLNLTQKQTKFDFSYVLLFLVTVSSLWLFSTTSTVRTWRLLQIQIFFLSALWCHCYWSQLFPGSVKCFSWVEFERWKCLFQFIDFMDAFYTTLSWCILFWCCLKFETFTLFSST